jgi:hypothetical protein
VQFSAEEDIYSKDGLSADSADFCGPARKDIARRNGEKCQRCFKQARKKEAQEEDVLLIPYVKYD